MAPSRLTDSQKQELLVRYRAGESSAALAAFYGCSPNTVSRTVRALLTPEQYDELKSVRARAATTTPEADPVAAPELPEAMDEFNTGLVAAMTPESQPQPRVTLTRAVLAQARFTALHLKGEDKLETLRRACSALDDVFAMPVRAFLKPGLEVFWSP